MTPIRHHPSMGPLPDDVDLTNAERAVVDAAIAATHAEDALGALTNALTARRGDPRIDAYNDALAARERAHGERRVAVRRLLQLRRGAGS